MNPLDQAIGQISSLEQLSGRDGPLQRLHPLGKLLVTLGFLVTVTSCPPNALSRLCLFFFWPLVLAPLSGAPLPLFLKRLSVALPFALFAALSNLLLNRELLFVFRGIPVTAGLVSCVSLLLKALLCVSSVLILISVTPLLSLVEAMRQLGLPRILCLQFLLTFRYLSLLLEEALQMHTAYILRTGRSGGIRMQDMGFFLGQLLLRSYDRAGKIYCAMKCRGYDGDFRSASGRPFPMRERLCALLLLLLFVLLRFLPLPGTAGR